MAKNLRAKIPESDTLIVCDVNKKATKQFVEEVGLAASHASNHGKQMRTQIADNPQEVAQKSVSSISTVCLFLKLLQ